MSRKFPDFLTAFEEWANDGFVPPQFNTFGCLSIIAGALERRVWLPWSDRYSFYPNLYVLLVSKPGQGKSVSSKAAFDLLHEVGRRSGVLNIMPTQVTEAKFIELMGHGRSFTDTSTGKELMVFQNAGYYYASEASNSLRNIFGDFIACLTDFYDCPTAWERATKKDGRKIALKNVCMNVLAGSTFDYLNKLVSDENIQGGFASRLLYVVQRDEVVKVQKWQNGQDAEIRKLRNQYHEALLQDLTAISQMTGPMQANREFGEAWEAWYPEQQRQVLGLKSEKLQSILARTNTNVLKISMLLSASESADRVMKLHHFERAVKLVEGLNAEVPQTFLQARASGGPRSAGNPITAYLIHQAQKPGATLDGVRGNAVLAGHSPAQIDATLNELLRSGAIVRGNASAGSGISLIVKGNADDHL